MLFPNNDAERLIVGSIDLVAVSDADRVGPRETVWVSGVSVTVLGGVGGINEFEVVVLLWTLGVMNHGGLRVRVRLDVGVTVNGGVGGAKEVVEESVAGGAALAVAVVVRIRSVRVGICVALT